MKCIYYGQFDDSRPGNDIPVTEKDIRMYWKCNLIILKSKNLRPSVKSSIK